MAAKRNASQKKRLTTLAATTKEQKQKLLECLSHMPTVESACRKADVGRATYYDWLRVDSKFASAAVKAKKKGRELLSDIAISKLMQLVGEGNVTAIIFWLKHNNEWFANPRFYHHIEIKEDPGVEDKVARQIKETMVKFISTAAEKGQADRFLHPERFNKKRKD